VPRLVGELRRLRQLVGLSAMATPHEDTGSTFELTAADLTDGFTAEGLGDETALGTWGSASSWSSASCPASTAATAGSASSFG